MRGPRDNSRGFEKFRCRFAPRAAKNAPGAAGEPAAAQFRRGLAMQFAMQLRAFVLALAALLGVAAHAEPPDGRAVFNQQCAVCHQPNGEGAAGQFPPLAHNPDLFLSPDYPARVLLFGLSGKINVNGQTFDSTMPPLDVLSDQQIAAVVAYVRSNFGNAVLNAKSLRPVDAATVAQLRAKKDTTASHVYEYRQTLKGGGR
jgi:mono/diheme cytochrome c family protein